MSNLTLVAPIKGWVAPLDEVPDPVFAERLLGDGLAIDPTGDSVHAPCDGIVVSVARHAVTLRASNGAEILIHVGLETVALHGQGFVTHVRDGQSVRTGDPLIAFDLDFLAMKAKSLISPVVVTNGDAFAIVRRSGDRETECGEFLMELRPLSERAEQGVSEASRQVLVRLPHGVHARPAAQISGVARKFECDVEVVCRERHANAKSVAALMSLAVQGNEQIRVSARGQNAHRAVDEIVELIEHGIVEEAAEPAAPIPLPPVAENLPSNAIRGVSGAPGTAIGRVYRLHVSEQIVVEHGAGRELEAARLRAALDGVRSRLGDLKAAGNRQQHDILGAHLALLDDPELLNCAAAEIAADKSAAFAWRAASRQLAGTFRALKDGRMRERASDVLDLERQVLAALLGEAHTKPESLPPDAIVLAEELLPSELAILGTVAGIVTASGGPTSHVAILAAGKGIPTVVGCGPRVLEIADGAIIVLDASTGLLYVEPGLELLEDARRKIERQTNAASDALARAAEVCVTADGVRVLITANLGSGADEALAAVQGGAEGCGLLRTEFLFQDRDTSPSADEQFDIYQAIATALSGRPFKIRTFDIGGDKPVPYLPLPFEENPALGLRGVRAGLMHRDLLRTQLAAILRVSPLPSIMLPMVSSLEEIRAVREQLAELGAPPDIQLGIMVETPASAMLAAQFSEDADFFSVGTNDLTQYTLAMDRGHPELAPHIDAYHPAVLALIARAVSGAERHCRPVSVCGGLASEPLAAALLLGLGIRELSMPAAAIPRMKDVIRSLDIETCRAAARDALQQNSPRDVRAIAARLLQPSGDFQ
ncbi:MAG: phosphoenolpyruvate--protein phosphotransferase [Proteobacteria bacterium]|nr:phosphoenolpyruvate--protein phosphotransferase [Pseudomonadota bacterium]